VRTGALVLAYKQEDYVAFCIRSISPSVDLVLVLFSEEPFTAYNPRARSHFSRPDRTGQILRDLDRETGNLAVLEGVWNDEATMRNAGLAYLRGCGVEACLIVDADEIYPEGGIEALRGEIERRNRPGSVYFSRYETCYRRFDYVVESDHRLPVAVHLEPSTTFPLRRRPVGDRVDLPDRMFFWHMGYVLSDARMWEKINTFSHAHEVVDGWFEQKWLGWTPQTRDLFRKEPVSRWPRAVRIDPRMLPGILRSHPFFPSDRDVPE
jgi:glycosyltransferase involved in cell wall biosynthesis